MQETFVRAARGIERYTPDTDPEAWIFSIARRVAADIRPTPASPLGETPPRSRHRPSGRSGRCARLPSDLREVVVLKELLRWKPDRIALVLGCEQSDVTHRLLLARTQLADNMRIVNERPGARTACLDRDHDGARRLMAEAMEGQLGQADERELALHLVECEECKGIYEGLQQAHPALESIELGYPSTPSLDAAVHRATTVLRGEADPGPHGLTDEPPRLPEEDAHTVRIDSGGTHTDEGVLIPAGPSTSTGPMTPVAPPPPPLRRAGRDRRERRPSSRWTSRRRTSGRSCPTRRRSPSRSRTPSRSRNPSRSRSSPRRGSPTSRRRSRASSRCELETPPVPAAGRPRRAAASRRAASGARAARTAQRDRVAPRRGPRALRTAARGRRGRRGALTRDGLWLIALAVTAVLAVLTGVLIFRGPGLFGAERRPSVGGRHPHARRALGARDEVAQDDVRAAEAQPLPRRTRRRLAALQLRERDLRRARSPTTGPKATSRTSRSTSRATRSSASRSSRRRTRRAASSGAATTAGCSSSRTRRSAPRTAACVRRSACSNSRCRRRRR